MAHKFPVFSYLKENAGIFFRYYKILHDHLHVTKASARWVPKNFSFHFENGNAWITAVSIASFTAIVRKQ
jgi:hypothetical protein